MLRRLKMDEESSSDASSLLSNEAATPSLSELETLDLSSNPSLSSVFRASGEDGSSSSQPNSRAGSPSRSLFHRRKSSQGGGSRERKKEKENHMCRWLQAGNVIYKSVGIGLMDLTVGMKVIEFAKQKGVGQHVEGF